MKWMCYVGAFKAALQVLAFFKRVAGDLSRDAADACADGGRLERDGRRQRQVVTASRNTADRSNVVLTANTARRVRVPDGNETLPSPCCQGR